MNIWRDLDSSSPRFGLVIRPRGGVSLYAGRRLYRVAWGFTKYPRRAFLPRPPAGTAPTGATQPRAGRGHQPSP